MFNSKSYLMTQQCRQRYRMRKYKLGMTSVMFTSFIYIYAGDIAQAATATTVQSGAHVAAQVNTDVSSQTENQAVERQVPGTSSFNGKDEAASEGTSTVHETAEESTTTSQSYASESPQNETLQPLLAASQSPIDASNTTSMERAHATEKRTTSENISNTNHATIDKTIAPTTQLRATTSYPDTTTNDQMRLSSTIEHAPAMQAKAQVVKVDEIDETVYQKQIGVLQNPETAQTLGMWRGTRHGRDSLGLIVPAQTPLYIRQSAEENEGDLRVNLVTDDSQKNQTVVVPKNGEWVKVQTDVDSGAFVYLPRGFRTQPQVDYYVENNQGKTLLTYQQGDDQAAFEQQWRDQNASFVLVDGQYNAFLIPQADREYVEAMGQSEHTNTFKNLDQMLAYYDDVIQKYNQWVGLNDDAESIHYNVEQKYFTMADKNGFGTAYWSGDHMGSNAPSLRGYLQPGWLALHEIGHGYDGWMIGDSRMELVEVWNNILANEYQTHVSGVDNGWLYQGQQSTFQARVQDELLHDPSQFSFDQLGLRERLDFMTRMVRLTTMAGVTDMLKSMREEATKGSMEKDVPRWIMAYWLADHGYNGQAYFDIYQIPLEEKVIDHVSTYPNSYIYPLALLIEDEAERQAYQTKLGLSSIYELVRTQDIHDTAMRSQAVVHIQQNGQILPPGSVIQLKDGDEVIDTAIIQDDHATFENIRPGVYRIVAPLSQSYALPDSSYIVVRQVGGNEATIVYPKSQRTQSTLTQRLSLQGLSNDEFVGIDYDPYTKEVTYHQAHLDPHYYFTDEYAHVTIKDQLGNVLLDRSYIGDQAPPKEDLTLLMQYGDTIQVTHREAPSRLKVFRIENGNAMSMSHSNSQTVTYRLTDKGFVVEGEAIEAVEERYATQMQSDVKTLIADMSQYPERDFRTRLYRIVQGIQYVRDPERTELLDQLQPYLSEAETMYTPEPTITTAERDERGVVGVGEVNASIEVTFPSGAVVTTVVTEEGQWRVTMPEFESFKPGDIISAVATIPGKFPSQTVQAPVTDTKAPSPVVVQSFDEHTLEIKGEADAETTVMITLPNQQILSTQPVDGHWSIQLPADVDLIAEDHIIVIARDRFGNKSPVTIVSPNKSAQPDEAVEIPQEEESTAEEAMQAEESAQPEEVISPLNELPSQTTGQVIQEGTIGSESPHFIPAPHKVSHVILPKVSSNVMPLSHNDHRLTNQITTHHVVAPVPVQAPHVIVKDSQDVEVVPVIHLGYTDSQNGNENNRHVSSVAKGQSPNEVKHLPNTGEVTGLDWKAILLTFFGLSLLLKRSKRDKKQQ